jgi:hypothetical protein
MFLACTVHAAVVKTIETDKAPAGPFAGDPYNPPFANGPSATDLLNGALPSASSGDAGFQLETSKGLAALTDGSVATFYGTQTAASNHTAYATAGNGGGAGTTATYDLGGKYNLSSIVIFGGWNDAGRDEQNYDLQTSTDGVNFVTLASTGSVNPGIQGTDTTPVSTRIAFTEDALANLASGVSHIRVNFLPVENGYTGYTEIDVFGTLIPEPGTMVLAGLAALGLAALRRRRA